MNRVNMEGKMHKRIKVTENQGLLFILEHNAKTRQFEMEVKSSISRVVHY